MVRTGHREAVAAEVRATVARQQVSLSELSERTGIAKSTLSNKLRGKTDFSISELIDVAIALDVPTADLLPPAAGVAKAAAS